MSQMKIRSKKGASCRRLVQRAFPKIHNPYAHIHFVNFVNSRRTFVRLGRIMIKEWWTARLCKWFKEIATFVQKGALTHTQLVSLSRGFWNRAIYGRRMGADDMTMRCFFFVDWCVCIGVKYLQDGFTTIQTHAMTRRCVALFLWIDAFVYR